MLYVHWVQSHLIKEWRTRISSNHDEKTITNGTIDKICDSLVIHARVTVALKNFKACLDWFVRIFPSQEISVNCTWFLVLLFSYLYLPYLSKVTSGPKLKCIKLPETFSGTVFHALFDTTINWVLFLLMLTTDLVLSNENVNNQNVQRNLQHSLIT